MSLTNCKEMGMIVVRQARSSKLSVLGRVALPTTLSVATTHNLLYKGTNSQASNSLANEMFKMETRRNSRARPSLQTASLTVAIGVRAVQLEAPSLDPRASNLNSSRWLTRVIAAPATIIWRFLTRPFSEVTLISRPT